MKICRGFTLIEVIIYAGIIGAILVSMVLITKAMYETRARVRSSIILEENLRFALSRVTSAIRQASAVIQPDVGTGSTLSLTMSDPGDDPTVVTETNGIVFLSEGTGASMALTSTEVEVTGLSFTRSTGTSPIIRTTITGRLRNATGPYQTEQTLTNSAVIRR
jgi:Tfp pilus assembly protein PilW